MSARPAEPFLVEQHPRPTKPVNVARVDIGQRCAHEFRLTPGTPIGPQDTRRRATGLGGFVFIIDRSVDNSDGTVRRLPLLVGGVSGRSY